MAAALLSGNVAVAAADSGTVNVSGAIDQSMVAATHTASAYLTIDNTGRTDDRLLSVSCRWCGRVEIHATRMDHRKSVMQRLAYGVKIPAGSRVAFSPATLHVMIINPRRVLSVGQSAELVLNFRRAGSVRIMLPITDMCRVPPAKTVSKPQANSRTESRNK